MSQASVRGSLMQQLFAFAVQQGAVGLAASGADKEQSTLEIWISCIIDFYDLPIDPF